MIKRYIPIELLDHCSQSPYFKSRHEWRRTTPRIRKYQCHWCDAVKTVYGPAPDALRDAIPEVE